jgi:hypothetical protein
MSHIMAGAVLIGSVAMSVACSSVTQVTWATPASSRAAATSGAEPLTSRGTAELPLGATRRATWGNVVALEVSTGTDQPSRAITRVVVRTCLVPTGASGAFMTPASLEWTLVDGSGRSHPSTGRGDIGQPHPVYRAVRGPQRIGTCHTSRLSFAMPELGRPTTVRYAIPGGGGSSWHIDTIAPAQ